MNLRELVHRILDTHPMAERIAKTDSPEVILEDGRKVLNLYLREDNKIIIEVEK